MVIASVRLLPLIMYCISTDGEVIVDRNPVSEEGSATMRGPACASTVPLNTKSLMLNVPPDDEEPQAYNLKVISVVIPWNSGPERSIVAPAAAGIPISLAKPSRLDRKENCTGPVPEDCPVYSKLWKLISAPTAGVIVK